MNYQSGRMGIAEGLALSFIITFPTLFQSTPALIAEQAGNFSWAAALLAGLAYGALLFIQLFLIKRYSGDLLTVTETLLGKYATWFVGLFFWFVFFGTACIWTRQFAENTLLTALPYAEFDSVVFWYALTAVLLVYLGIETLARASYVVLPFILAGVALVVAGLASVIKPLYFFPWQGHGLTSLANPVLDLVGTSVPVTLLLFMAPAFQNPRALQSALIYGFGGGIVLRSFVNMVYIMIFGVAVASEKTLPFYEMARLIYINKYVQRLEALFILLWVIVGVLGIAVCLYGSLYIIARLAKLPSVRPLIIPLGLIMTQVAAMLPDSATVVLVGMTVFSNVFAPGVAAVTFALLAAALIRGGKKQCDSA